MNRMKTDRALSALRSYWESDLGDTLARGAGVDPRLHALDLFRGIARDVPAYRVFLERAGVDAASVTTFEQFAALPATTKDNYHRAFPLPQLYRGGQLDACDFVAVSSGSTGPPAVWPRFVADEIGTAWRIEQILADAMGASTKRTLNVYPENVAIALERPDAARHVTGKFVMEIVRTRDEDPALQVTVELARDAVTDGTLAETLARSIRAETERVNSEFLHYAPADRRTPIVALLPLGHPEYFPTGVKHRYTRG